jgi:hypothetical protein
VALALASGTKSTKDDLAALRMYVSELADKIKSGKWKGHELADLINARVGVERDIQDILSGPREVGEGGGASRLQHAGRPAGAARRVRQGARRLRPQAGGRREEAAEAAKKAAEAATEGAAGDSPPRSAPTCRARSTTPRRCSRHRDR